MRTTAPSRTCDCCKERVRLTDEDGLCFNCDLVRTFATIIEEQTDLAGDAAIDLACELVDCARSRIFEFRENDEAKDFFRGRRRWDGSDFERSLRTSERRPHMSIIGRQRIAAVKALEEG